MTTRLGVGLAFVEEFELVLRLCRYILDLQLRGRPREAPPRLARRLPRRPDLGGALKEVPGHLRPRAALPDLPRSPALRRLEDIHQLFALQGLSMGDLSTLSFLEMPYLIMIYSRSRGKLEWP
ncbi:hypothetical protein ZIOFF_059706 [Zingiber officinale]|uniref:Uncharacterized protein n=1 Tax=Zingiber officinale TaxID=94328 RepID=A0A8J5FDL4_ZINOF|nr:hypothetical protein ZIOFF_059706 [Zingiber officinale]